jgi:hypothetical protein
MGAYCTSAWTFIFVANIPKLLTMCACSIDDCDGHTQVVAGSTEACRRAGHYCITVFVVGPLIDKALAPIMAAIASLAPTGEWCALPTAQKC